MSIEDLSTYTETDPNSRITRTTRRVTWTGLTRNEDAYVYKDKGADHFNGNFVHLLTIRATGYTGTSGTVNCGAYWSVANLVDDWGGIDTANGDGLFLLARVNTSNGDQYIQIIELDGGAGYTSASAYEITVNTTYYIKIVRDESIGTYGTLYCYTYSDPARATLVNTQTITLHSSKKDYRYIYPAQSANAADATRSHSGYTENLELFSSSDPGVIPTVTIQPVTAITNTTATGNGIIVDLGLSAVTAHGHCWATTIDPTTSDSSVDNGAGTVGSFTSSLTSLLAGQQYFCRAYATNTEGTAYSANVVFTAGYTSTQLIQGNLAIVQERLQYIDAYGVERYITGARA